MSSRGVLKGLSTRSQNIKVTTDRQVCKPMRGQYVANENTQQPKMKKSVASSNILRDSSNKSVGGLKRKSNDQLGKENPKRSAFGDLTNAIEKTIREGKKEVQKISISKTKVTRNQVPLNVLPRRTQSINENVTSITSVKTKLTKTSSKGLVKLDDVIEDSFCDSLPSSQGTISHSSEESNKVELELADTSTYVTASEESPLVPKLTIIVEEISESCSHKSLQTSKIKNLPEGVEDYDQECENDVFSVPTYAQEVFNYYKEREKSFPILKYLKKQRFVTKGMRSILIDWMVEVQESFELNHETLYLAVKLVDLYLSKVIISREILQLVGSTSLFIACKFDERMPPCADDFLFICDNAYKKEQLFAYEIKMLKTIKYDLGVPLSYRFLRRYARCAKVTMEDLTLARYILESSLMEYDLIDTSDSALAAAAMLLSRAIKGNSTWTPTLQHYSGYSVEDIYHLVQVLHNMMLNASTAKNKTIFNKYSHKVFFEVAKIPIPEQLDI